ncbi:HD domain-containing phosphohydrolase [Chloroflexota bacterium]
MIPNSGATKATPMPAEPGDHENKARLDLLYEVSKKVSSTSRLARLLERVVQMTQCTLKAAASSVLLISDSDEEQELVFEVVGGPAGKALRHAKINARNGIAGWVARTGKPAIVNDVAKDPRFDKTIDLTTGFVTRSIICTPMIVQRKITGVIEVLNKLDGSNFSEHDLETLISVTPTAAMAIENARLHQSVLDAYKGTIRALAAAIDAKDPYTRGHSERVMEYVLQAGQALSLPEDELEVLEYASILHDIGKISIADNILNKPDSLTPKEWAIMHTHPATGANMIKDIPFLAKASELVRHHHERYDGTGYPDGLQGSRIPIGARLIAVADAFDTMTTDRAYRPALTLDYTISELHGCAGTQFCPLAIKAFVSGLRQSIKNFSNNSTPETRQPVGAGSRYEHKNR